MKTFRSLILLSIFTFPQFGLCDSLSQWEKYSVGEIDGADYIGMTDVSDGASGTSKAGTVSQLAAYLGTLGLGGGEGVDLTGYYTKLETDVLLSDKADNVGLVFVLSTLTDILILDAAEPVDGSNWLNDSLNYGDTDDNLHLWSIEEIGSRLYAEDINSSATITALIETATDADAHTLTSSEYHGGEVLATGAGVYTLPAAASGLSGCVRAGQGVTAIIQLLPATGDYIVFEGVRGTAATSIKSAGNAGDRICYMAHNGDDWYVDVFGTWAE